MQADVWKGSVRLSIFVFAIREAREPPIVPPVRRGKVTAKTRRQHPSSKRRQVLRQNLSVAGTLGFCFTKSAIVA